MKSGDVKISRFRVKAYRSCKNTLFHPSQSLTALIGPNGAGKTNLLNAMLLMKLSRRRGRLREPDVQQLKSQIEIDFTFKKRTVQLRSRLVFGSSETNRDEVLNASEKWNFKNLGWSEDWITTTEALVYLQDEGLVAYPVLTARGERIRYINPRELSLLQKKNKKALRRAPQIAKDAFRAIQEFRSKINYYSASQFTNPSYCPTSLEVDEDGDFAEPIRPERREHTRFIGELYQLYRAKADAYDRYLSLVKRIGVGLIDDLKWKAVTFKSTAFEVQSGGKIINKKRERILIIPTIHIGASQLSFNQLSEGTLRTLALLFYIVTDNSSLLLIEEPEVCIHHGLLKSIIEIMTQFGREKQIVLSTHSDFIVDTLPPEQVLLVRNDKNEGTTVTPISKAMSKTEYAALKEYLETTGTLGEFWKQSGFAQ